MSSPLEKFILEVNTLSMPLGNKLEVKSSKDVLYILLKLFVV